MRWCILKYAGNPLLGRLQPAYPLVGRPVQTRPYKLTNCGCERRAIRMDEQRKSAYRWLFYMAMLDIRSLRWVGRGWRRRLNPFCWWSCSRRVHIAGSIAEMLHNLAIYSALDFAGFDEDWFWRDYQWMLDDNPGAGLERYRREFERRTLPAEA